MCKLMKGGACTANPHRLPRTVMPSHYRLRVVPNIAEATFSGTVEIDVDVVEPVSKIVLNAADLKVSGASLNNADGTSFKGAVSYNAKAEQVTIAVRGVAGKGMWQLKLAFAGKISEKLRGFYLSKSKDGSHTVAATQFESIEARHAFPCFDEPDMKAVFSIEIVCEIRHAAISNMRVTSEEALADGKKLVKFAPTFKMSTYLVAYAIGDLVATEPVNVDGIDFRIWSVPGTSHLTRFGLEAAAFAFRMLGKYFEVPYPGDKIDMVALPEFEAGAMENPGCITFRQSALLVDLNHASQKALERIAAVVAHELAHLWFGDLVTMTWWRFLWLNEAFATFMETKVVDAWKRSWDFWTKFALARGSAMHKDALLSTRAVEFEIMHPDDAEGMFDVLTYEKGCSVLRMLEQYIGEETFRRGIVAYMKQHAFGNTTGDDLWAALEASSGIAVGKIMHGWVLAGGFPLVSVSRGEQAGTIVLSQEPFKYLSGQAADQLWSVPLFLRAATSGGVVETKLLLEEKSKTIYVGEGLGWVLVNAGGHGFMRVRYADDLAAALAPQASKLAVIDRFNLVADAWACALAGQITSVKFMELVKGYAGETDPSVWSVILGALGSIKRVTPEANRPVFEAQVRTLLAGVHARLGWDAKAGETPQQSDLRGKVIAALGGTGADTTVQAEARKRYGSWKTDAKSVHPDVIGAVIHLCAVSGDGDLYEEFVTAYKEAKTPQDEGRFLAALASFGKLELLSKTLEHARTSGIAGQDAPHTIAQVMGTEVGGKAAWEFIKTHWDELSGLFSEGAFLDMCEGVSALDWSDTEQDVKTFFAGRQVKGGKQSIDQALEELRVNVAFRHREQPALAAAFPLPPAPAEDAVIEPSGSDDGAKRGPTVEERATKDA